MGLTFGVCVNAVDTPRDFIRLAQAVEAGGFDYLWIPDIALMAREVISYLTLAAVNTSTIRLGPAVFHPFVRHPAYSASTIATLDEISEGRIVFGMGLGGREILQEVACDAANIAELREWVAVSRRLLAGEAVSVDGPRYRMQNARLRFKSRPNIPVYVAATGPKMLSLAGELGEGAFALVGVHPKCVGLAVSQVAKGAVASGRAARDVDLGLYIHCAISRAGEKALDECRRGAGLLALRNPSYAELAGIAPGQLDAMKQAASAAGSSFGKGFAETVPDEIVRKFSLAGTPAECRQALEAVAGSGIHRIDIYLQGSGREETVRLFAEEILPALRRA